MWGLLIETDLKLCHSSDMSPHVSLSKCFNPRWSGHPACPSEPLCTLNQHEASVDVEPSGCAWRNNTLFCRVPGVSFFVSNYSPFKEYLIPGGIVLIAELKGTLWGQGQVISHDLPPLSAWALRQLKKQGKLSCGFDTELSGNISVYKHILVQVLFNSEPTV